jgi:ABC-type multidrug transport system fused ATPase/permease subunit
MMLSPIHIYTLFRINVLFAFGSQVIELIKRTPKESPPGDFVPDSGTLQGALALENVVFSYPIRPTQQVLNGLSMSVNPGALLVVAHCKLTTAWLNELSLLHVALF